MLCVAKDLLLQLQYIYNLVSFVQFHIDYKVMNVFLRPGQFQLPGQYSNHQSRATYVWCNVINKTLSTNIYM